MRAKNTLEWVLRLPNLLNSHGFEDATLHRYHTPKELLKFSSQMVVGVLLELGLAEPEGSESQKKSIDMFTELCQEIDQGAAQSVANVVCVAMKAA